VNQGRRTADMAIEGSIQLKVLIHLQAGLELRVIYGTPFMLPPAPVQARGKESRPI
jgi:hypothetical protein